MKDILLRIRRMNDTEFNMLCNLLGLNDNQVSGVQTVPVTGKPSVMYPVNPVNPAVNPAVNPVNPAVNPVNPVNPVSGQNQPVNGKWHNFPVTSDPNFDSEKSYGHIFQVNGAYYVFFVPKSLCKLYNNVLSFGIQENKYYTIYSITDYQNKQKTKCPEITGKDLAVMLGI